MQNVVCCSHRGKESANPLEEAKNERSGLYEISVHREESQPPGECSQVCRKEGHEAGAVLWR